MLWLIISILFVFWLFGNIVSFGGDLIHLLLVIALIVFIWNMVTNRRNRV